MGSVLEQAEVSRVWREGDVVVIDHGSRQSIGREDVLRLVQQRRALGGGRQCVLVRSAGKAIRIQPDALAATLEPAVVDVTEAVAYVITNPMMRWSFNWYQRCRKPPYPVAAFGAEPEARAWLSTVRLLARLSASQKAS